MDAATGDGETSGFSRENLRLGKVLLDTTRDGTETGEVGRKGVVAFGGWGHDLVECGGAEVRGVKTSGFEIWTCVCVRDLILQGVEPCVEVRPALVAAQLDGHLRNVSIDVPAASKSA